MATAKKAAKKAAPAKKAAAKKAAPKKKASGHKHDFAFSPENTYLNGTRGTR